MSRCPYCGTEAGMAMGTGDCDCQGGYEVGMGIPTAAELAEAGERQQRGEAAQRRRAAAGQVKVIIELEGPGIAGAAEAQDLLFMAGFPPDEDGPTSGSYADTLLGVRCSWTIQR